MVRALAVTVLALFAMGARQAPSPDGQSNWQSLFDGRTLTGWQPSERPESWKIEGGAIVMSDERSHLFYVGPVANHTFKNFELSAEVMATPGSNSGIYVHTALQGRDFRWPATSCKSSTRAARDGQRLRLSRSRAR